tara:strand:+ start:17344 stop:17787 length:444 start_codon:yes stop_codon:yes gene_type:complete
MTFFTSEFECKLDAKGRLVLPSKLKSNLPAASIRQIVIRKGFEPNLIIYPLNEYKKLHNKISSLNEFNSEQRKLKRNFFSSIVQVDLDNNGRFLIPKNMLTHATINRQVIICGMGNVIEIWNDKIYKKHLINDSETYSELAQKYLDD